jgi:hypothetical protein
MCHSERSIRSCRRDPVHVGPTSGRVGPTLDQPWTNLGLGISRAGPTSQPFVVPHVRVRTRACTWRDTYLYIQVGLRQENKAFLIGPTSDQPRGVWSSAKRSVQRAWHAESSMAAAQCDGSSPGSVYCGPQSREIAPDNQEIVRLIRGLAVNRAGGVR